ncbi:hypothetical protein BKA69DRAFT_1071207 [Paraphysoderma sedebokerense]|nr:hypothetical protein BKA69DRAFT_1071207 [Paraphysoderma sedebokerense]
MGVAYKIWLFMFKVHNVLDSVVFRLLIAFRLAPKPKPIKAGPGSGVFITGTSSGIGYGTTVALLSKGYTIFAGNLPSEDITGLIKESRELPGTLIPLKVDVTKREMIEKAYSDVQTYCHDNEVKLVGLVNNAGVAYTAPLEIMDEKMLNRVMDVNLKGVVTVTRTFLPEIRKNQGRIVSVASVDGFITMPSFSLYCATKHGVEGLTDALRQELSPFNVSVAAIEPGVINTGLHDTLVQSLKTFETMSPDQTKTYGKHIESITKATEFLLSRKMGLMPEDVSVAIMHAIESDYPRTRYLVGVDAYLHSWARRNLSDRALDIYMKILL